MPSLLWYPSWHAGDHYLRKRMQATRHACCEKRQQQNVSYSMQQTPERMHACSNVSCELANMQCLAPTYSPWHAGNHNLQERMRARRHSRREKRQRQNEKTKQFFEGLGRSMSRRRDDAVSSGQAGMQL